MEPHDSGDERDDLAALDFSVAESEPAESDLDALGGYADDPADGDDPSVPVFTVTNPPGTVTVTAFLDGRVKQIELSPKAADMTETDLADEIVVIAGLATQDARSAQYAHMLDGMRQQGHDDVATRDFLAETWIYRPQMRPKPLGHRRSRQDTQVVMTEHLASLFGSAVGMLTSSQSRSFELFTEVTNIDESACDAWVGRIRCGDTDRVTLFRAWYSRSNFGHLAGSAEISMNSLNARIPIGGMFGDITYPINSPLAITMGFAVHEASIGNYADAMEALDDVPSTGAEHLVSWVKAVLYGAAERWTDVIDEVRGAGGWPDKFLAAAAGVAHGVAAANLGLLTEAERRLTESNSSPAGEACAPAIAWYLAMTRRSQGNEEAAVALLEWLQATHPEPKVSAALKDPSYRLITTTAEKIASRSDPWDPASVVADTSGREKLLAEAQAELDRQIGLTRVKEQIDAYRAATQMAKIRAARGMKVAQASKHMIFAGPPGTGKTTIARVVANILAGLGVIAEPKLVESSRKDFVAEYEGQSAVKTSRTIDRAVGGVLFIDEAYTLVQERDGRADPFGTEALDTLLARMENDRDRLVVIIAGYSADIDRLLESNDGLRSRFANRIEFDSYTPDEIVDIAKVIAAANDSTLDEEAAKRVLEAATLLSQRSLNGKPALDIAGNGRYARQLVEAGEQSRDMRLSRSLDFENLGVEQLSEVTGEDMASAIAAIHARLGIGE